MQSCPKNGLTGPLTGDSKRSNILSIAKESVPLPPVASLALPLEPASATGPPSPARGSAGMPPPPSPAGATYQSAPKVEGVDTVECKPLDKTRKARVGKAMVRNNMAAAANNIHQNTMLLMCHPLQTTYVSNVKREVESPKEVTKEQKRECGAEENQKLSMQCNGTSCKKCISDKTETICNERTQENHQLKTENQIGEETCNGKDIPEEKQPCQKTVAETVKVKNMKRKIIPLKDIKTEPETVCVPQKKQKIDRPKAVNGSYKDLIKKNTSCVKINNGKRKLNVDTVKGNHTKFSLCKTSKLKFKKLAKRKLSALREEAKHKNLKSLKPLAASSLHNSKQNLKENKEKIFINSDLRENKEPVMKLNKKSKLNCRNTSVKKLAPVLLDNLFAKNSVDRTIDSVIESGLKSNKESCALKADGKCLNCKSCKAMNSKKGTNVKNVLIKTKLVCKNSCASKRKTRSKNSHVVPQLVGGVPRKSLLGPRWSNGWTWEGEPFEAKVFINVSIYVHIR